MPKRSDESVQILDGKALLTRRSNSPYWQLKFRAGRSFLRVSTKCEDLEEAKDFALDYYLDARAKANANLPLITRKFKSVAEAVRNTMQNDFDNGIGPRIYRDYIQAIDNWLIPFFGNFNVASIEHKHVKAFYEWRREELGRDPANTTIGTHATAMGYVFAEAVDNGYMNKHHIPQLKLKGYAAKSNGDLPRASFTLPEYRLLYRYMRKWVRNGRNGKFREMRLLLRDAVLFLGNSGIRYGTEFYSIRWKNIQVGTNNQTGKEQLFVTVNGKVGHRQCVIRRGAKRYLERIWKRSDELSSLSWDELLTREEAVFALPDGTVTNALDKTFTRLLKDAGLHLDSNGQARSLYSLRHFYITQLLFSNRVSPAIVAKQCGTSIQMIEKHYLHFDVHQHAAQLSE